MLPQARCPHNRHVRRFLLCHPLSSLLGGLGETLGSAGSFPCFSAFLGHRGPLDAPQAFYVQGSGPSCVVGVSEGAETPDIFFLPVPPKPLSSISRALAPRAPRAQSFAISLTLLDPLLPDCRTPAAPGSFRPGLEWFPSGLLPPQPDEASPRGGSRLSRPGSLLPATRCE